MLSCTPASSGEVAIQLLPYKSNGKVGVIRGISKKVGVGEGSRPENPCLVVDAPSPSRLNLYEKRGESDVEAPQFLILHSCLRPACRSVNCRCGVLEPGGLVQHLSRPVIEMSEDPHSYRVAWAAGMIAVTGNQKVHINPVDSCLHDVSGRESASARPKCGE